MTVRTASTFLTAIALAGCAPAGIVTGAVPGLNMQPGKTEAAAASLAPGMTRSQVTALLGAPQGFLTEKNGTECLIYQDRDNSAVYGSAVYGATTARERVVVLKNGALVSHQLIASGIAPGVQMQMPGAPTVASACADAARG